MINPENMPAQGCLSAELEGSASGGKKGIKILYYVGLIIISLAGGFLMMTYVVGDVVYGEPEYSPGKAFPYSRSQGIPFKYSMYNYNDERADTPDGCRQVGIEAGHCGFSSDEPNFGINAPVDLSMGQGLASGCVFGTPSCLDSEWNTTMSVLDYIFWSGVCFALLFMVSRRFIKKKQ